MIPYRISITYYKNDLEIKIMILDDVIMTKTFIVEKRDNKYVCENEFEYREFEHLIYAMENNINHYIVYHGSDGIQYNSSTETLSFVSQHDDHLTSFDINLFNNDNNKNKNKFIDEFKKISKFISCIPESPDLGAE